MRLAKRLRLFFFKYFTFMLNKKMIKIKVKIKMAKYRIGTYQLMIEQYAKENKITIAKSIIHFINKDNKHKIFEEIK